MNRNELTSLIIAKDIPRSSDLSSFSLESSRSSAITCGVTLLEKFSEGHRFTHLAPRDRQGERAS